jgi:ACS family glucarate transporter-like MFS transporter
VAGDELELIRAGRATESSRESGRDWANLLVNRDCLLLSASYFCMNYVFYMFAQWLFTYLVEERGFSLLQSGFLYAIPFIVGAVLAAAGGLVCARIGPRWGCRIPGMVGMVMVAGLLVAGAYAANSCVAVGLLALCFGFTQFTEGAYWSGATYVGGGQAAATAGVLNTGGNLPGILAPVVGFMVDQLGWLPTLTSGAVFAPIGAGLWLLIRTDLPVTASNVITRA